MVTKAEYAEWVGRDDASFTDAEFQRILTKGKTRLEQSLGYQLCPLTTIDFCPPVETSSQEQLPVITLSYKHWQKTIIVPPFLELYSIKYESCDGVEYELEECDYTVKKTDPFADWAKVIELCKPVACGVPLCKPCIEMKVRAFWGLCCNDESGLDEAQRCCLPYDLEVVLLDMMVESDSCDKSNIKRESALSYSYEKFEKISLLETHAATIAKYGIPSIQDYPF